MICLLTLTLCILPAVYWVVSGVITFTGYEGGEVKIRCPYSMGYENNPKYLCRGDCPVTNKDIVVRTKDDRALALNGRFALSDNREGREFTVTISGLTHQDSGKYWCAISTGPLKMDVYTEVKLVVDAAETPSPTLTTLLTTSTTTATKTENFSTTSTARATRTLTRATLAMVSKQQTATKTRASGTATKTRASGTATMATTILTPTTESSPVKLLFTFLGLSVTALVSGFFLLIFCRKGNRKTPETSTSSNRKKTGTGNSEWGYDEFVELEDTNKHSRTYCAVTSIYSTVNRPKDPADSSTYSTVNRPKDPADSSTYSTVNRPKDPADSSTYSTVNRPKDPADSSIYSTVNRPKDPAVSSTYSTVNRPKDPADSSIYSPRKLYQRPC